MLGAIGGLLIVARAWSGRAHWRGLADGWGRVGHALGWFNSRVLLTVMFVLIIWPIGVISRLFGNDPLERRKREIDVDAVSRSAARPETLRAAVLMFSC